MAIHRYKRVIVTGELLCELITEGKHLDYTITNGLPKDAKFVGIIHELNHVTFVFESEEFKAMEYPEGYDMSSVPSLNLEVKNNE